MALTWSKNGAWGIEGVDLASLPPRAYGALCKLHDIERLANEINATTDAMVIYDLRRELLSLCGDKSNYGDD